MRSAVTNFGYKTSMAAVLRVCRLHGFWKFGTKFGGGVVKFLVCESNASKTEALAFSGWLCRFGRWKGSDGVDDLDPLEDEETGSHGGGELDDVDGRPAIRPFFTKLWNRDARSIGGDDSVELAAGADESV